MRKLFVLFISLFLWTYHASEVRGAAPDSAVGAEEEVFAAFEWFCLAHLDRPDSIAGLFEPLSVKPLPNKQAEAFLAPLKGTAWLMPGSKTKGFVISLSSSGVCSVNGPYVNGDETKSVFEKNIKHKQLDSEDMGSQIQSMYAVTYSSTKSGNPVKAIVSVVTTKLKTVDGIALSAIPEKVIIEEKLNVPEWP